MQSVDGVLTIFLMFFHGIENIVFRVLIEDVVAVVVALGQFTIKVKSFIVLALENCFFSDRTDYVCSSTPGHNQHPFAWQPIHRMKGQHQTHR